MPSYRPLFVLTLVTIIAVACAAPVPAAQETQEPATVQAKPEEGVTAEATPAQEAAAESSGDEAFEMKVVTTGLTAPLEIIYGPDDYLWITERTGKRVTRVNPADGSSSVALELPEAFTRGQQDGVLGMVLHPQFLQGSGNDYLYLSYTYQGEGGTNRQPNRRVKIVRYTYDPETETLGEPFELISELPGSGDHNSAKFVIGPDEKLYYSIGDQGNNQFARACLPILAQELPTAEEIAASDWSHYPGKILRMNLDGTIPDDNPTLNGVQSHVFTYGHRNVQGLAISDEGLLYGSEHGPKSDDEINLLEAGMNYGWPNVAGYQDDQAYVYGNWSQAPNCDQLQFSDFEVPVSVPLLQESEWSDANLTMPLLTFGTVEDGYDFQNEDCAPNEWICWPTVAPTGLTLYEAQETGVPGWPTSLLVTALKTGTVYRMELSEDGKSIVGDAIPYFKTTNRYRDVAIGADGRAFYVITDSGNWTLGTDGLPTEVLENPGAILEFRYDGD